MAINYFFEDIEAIKLQKRKINSLFMTCIGLCNKKVGNINIIFCSDEYLKEMNIQYLKHDYYTDVITFNYNEGNQLSGDIYISADRVLDNSTIYKVEFFSELLRVMVHGILHLLGYKDHTEKEKSEIRRQEELWISQYK
jgi:probable rRNA maturation factor